MAMGQGLSLTTAQKLTLSPQQKQALKLLQLNVLDLQATVEQALAENPFLEIQEDSPQTGSEESTESDRDKNKSLEQEISSLSKGVSDSSNESQDDGDRDTDSYDRYDFEPVSRSTDSNSKQQYLEGGVADYEKSLYAVLMEQIPYTTLRGDTIYIAEVLASCLTYDGYLESETVTLAEELDVDHDRLLDVLGVIQSLDPPGVGARNLQECLTIQARRRPDCPELSLGLLEDHFDLLAHPRPREVGIELRKRLGTPVENSDVEAALRFIASLEPHPGRDYGRDSNRIVVPDVIVRRRGEDLVIIMNDDIIPTVVVNEAYRKQLQKQKVNQETKTYISEKFSDAKMLSFAIQKRRETIFRVVEQLVDLQSDFFYQGPKAIKPLVLRDVAERINVHESTVSRVTNDKYIETPWGTYELKFFFSSSVGDQHEGRSSTSIKELIKEILEAEARKPDGKRLSDSRIAELLAQRGVKVARRTVAKYRQTLRILPSFQR